MFYKVRGIFVNSYWLRTLAMTVILALLVTFGTREFTMRHTLFLFLTSALFFAEIRLFKDVRSVVKFMAMFFLLGMTVLVIRRYTGFVIRSWDADTYIGFCMAVVNLFALLVAIVPWKIFKRVIVILEWGIISPILLVWGYFASTGRWLHADAIVAVVQTNPQEAMSYIMDTIAIGSIIGVAGMIILLVKSMSLIVNVRINRSVVFRGGIIALLMLLNLVLVYRCRNNVLFEPFYDARNQIVNDMAFSKNRQQRKSEKIELVSGGKPGIYVMVVGESQTRDHMNAYGYDRMTTPWLSTLAGTENFVNISNTYSCYPKTVQALSYALTAKNQYNSLAFEQAPSLVEVAKQAGYQVIWLSTQNKYGTYDTPITAIARDADSAIWESHCFDEQLAACLDDIKISDKMLIIIHLMGNHNTYRERYPQKFAHFAGEKDRIDEYDNSILYNDFVVHNIWEKLNKLPNFQALLYFADHGEGVDQGKMHDAGDFEWSMVRIPCYLLVSDKFRQQNSNMYEVIKENKNYVITNDLMYNFMLGIMNVRDSKYYEADNDFTNIGYNKDIKRFMTNYGEKKVYADMGKE
ncbi:MAG: phosphoethanolamine transferase [Selenomonas sp.]|uniref:phosphoethanolamine transferase n=1 Tax=Selenomonas sp. TaxID=2053611 RepID=UPI0025D70E4A|nr:phosphoethanolamine transferase [Selenomonas sp.]MCR5437971.1 phosphoethanolamine transferase [Selenomonas sp.]